ncbi:MAG: chemotaxis protein CheB, partial [Alphaproteobacteria bacterium]
PLILEKSPNSKVIMFSTLTEKGANITLKALSLGAVECLVKPASGEARKGGAFQTQLLNIVRNLADPAHCKTEQNSQTKTPAPSSAASPSSYSLRKNPHDYKGRPNILAIGSSTGGPQALFEVLSHCKNLNMPIVLTQHMPATFTKILAKHITQHTGLACDEGEEGMPLENNKVIVAPGGLHMILRQDDNNSVVVHLDDGPMVNFCKPAVDPMFESLLPIYGRKILAVILTGMGNDGLKASQKLAEAGCPLIAQDEKTSIVWGMPGAVAKAGICTAVLPLDQIGPSIQKAANG